MNRLLFNLLALLSALIAGAGVAVWIYTADAAPVDLTHVNGDGRALHLFHFWRGSLRFDRVYWETAPPKPLPPVATKEFLGVKYSRRYGDPYNGYGGIYINGERVTEDSSVLLVPLWQPVVLFSILPALWLVNRSHRWLARRRAIRAGLCLHCGYDLRGATGPCPECGRSGALTAAIDVGTGGYGRNMVQ